MQTFKGAGRSVGQLYAGGDWYLEGWGPLRAFAAGSTKGLAAGDLTRTESAPDPRTVGRTGSQDAFAVAEVAEREMDKGVDPDGSPPDCCC